MKTYLLSSKDRNAFTLMELLIVLVILIVIMALLIPNVTRMWDSANRKATEAQIAKFETALEAYRMDTGIYPTTNQGLMALIECPQMDNSATSLTPQSGPIGMPDPNSSLNMGTPQFPDPNSSFSPSSDQNLQQPWPSTPSPPTAPTQPTQGWAPQGPPGVDGPPQQQNLQSAWDQQNPTGPATFDSMPPTSMGDSMSGVPSMGDSMFGEQQPGQSGYGQQPSSGSSNLAAKLANAIRKWSGPYLDDVTVVPLDPWSNDFHYEYPTDKTKDGRPAIWSNGKDDTDPTWRISNFDEAETKAYKEQQQRDRQRRLQDWQQGRQGSGGTGTDTMFPGQGGVGTDTTFPGPGGTGTDTMFQGPDGVGTDMTFPGPGGTGTDTMFPGQGGVGTDTTFPGPGGTGTTPPPTNPSTPW